MTACSDGGMASVGSGWIDCPFDTVVEKLDPANWATYAPELFQGSAPSAPVNRSASGSWNGPLFEHVNLILLTIENELNIDMQVQQSAPRRANVSYVLNRSIDQKMSVDEGQLIVVEKSDALGTFVQVVFGKRIHFESPLVFSDYCARLEAFLTIGIDLLALSC
jgi:hypothetical protein